jgi:hypothetical protein
MSEYRSSSSMVRNLLESTVHMDFLTELRRWMNDINFAITAPENRDMREQLIGNLEFCQKAERIFENIEANIRADEEDAREQRDGAHGE